MPLVPQRVKIMKPEIIRILPSSGKNRGKRVEARCHCGNIFEARLSNINSGNTTSCGCDRGKRKTSLVKPKRKFKSHQVTRPKRQVTRPQRVAPPPEDIEEVDVPEETTEHWIQKALDYSPHLNEDTLADSLGMRAYQLHDMNPNELRNILEERGAI